MQTKDKIKKNLSCYLDYKSSARISTSNLLNKLSETLPDTVIFGGMLREFALGNIRQFSSDIDIVCQSSRTEIYQLIREYTPKQNKFGGYRFYLGQQLFDIWAFQDTWAFREGLVEAAKFDDIFRTTFFNMDAAAFRVKDREILYSENFGEALTDKVLDINLEANPAPTQMAKRAIRMAISDDLYVSRRLGEYILENYICSEIDNIGNSFIASLKKSLDSDLERFKFNPQQSLIW